MPDIITRALLESKGIPTRDIVAAIWGRKLSGGYEPAELTGTLPLTFRSNGTAIVDYRIYGNTADVPINLWTIPSSQYQFDLTTPLKAGKTYTYSVFKEDIADRADYIYMYDSNATRVVHGVCIHSDGNRIYVTMTPTLDVYRIVVNSSLTDALRMLTEGDTPPDEYISPETTDVQGVGVRTAAGEPSGYKLPMISKNNLIGGMPLVPTAVNASGTTYPGVTVTAPPAGKYTLTWTKVTAITSATMMIFTMSGTSSQRIGYAPAPPWTYTLPSGVDKLMIVAATPATDPTWEALGFKDLALTTQSTENPIYIGDTQLMQDEYVSYSEQAVYKNISLYGINEDNIDTLNLSTGILTRKVKKMVLNGTENFVYQGHTYSNSFVLDIPDISLNTFRVFSNYFQGNNSLPGEYYRKDKIFVTLHPNYIYHAIAIGSSTWSGDVAAFKNFLAEKYASGNPVTVWYVLEFPETTNLPVSSKASGTLDGYLVQDGTPSPSNPIYPTYARTHYPTDPPVPLPELPTFSNVDTVLDCEEAPTPEEVWVKYKKGD